MDNEQITVKDLIKMLLDCSFDDTIVITVHGNLEPITELIQHEGKVEVF